MVRFKDYLEQDFDTFFNEHEFAEVIKVNGEPMLIVRDEFGVDPYETEKQLAKYDVYFHVESSNFKYIPQSEKLMDFDGEIYRIEEVEENMGVLSIGLSRNES